MKIQESIYSFMSESDNNNFIMKGLAKSLLNPKTEHILEPLVESLILGEIVEAEIYPSDKIIIFRKASGESIAYNKTGIPILSEFVKNPENSIDLLDALIFLIEVLNIKK